MASADVPSRVSSASNVMLLAAGMRPLIVIAPWLRNSSALLDDMAIAAGTGMAGRVLRLAAHRADGPAGLHQLPHTLHEGGGLTARDVNARDGGLLLRLLLEKLSRFQHHAVVVLVVANTEGRDRPRRGQRLEQRGVAGLFGAVPGELRQESAQVLTERADLLLLALQGEQLPGLARLEVEHALPGRPDRTYGEIVGSVELEGVAHRNRIPLTDVGWLLGGGAQRIISAPAPARRDRRPWS